MKRFTFRLQSLLRLRRLHEQEAEAELQRVQGALLRSRRRLEEIEEERRLWSEQYNIPSRAVDVAAAERLLVEQYFAALDRQTLLQQQEIARHEENVRVALRAYQQKLQALEQVDRLRTRAAVVHHGDVVREEMRDLDALNAVRFVRGRRLAAAQREVV